MKAFTVHSLDERVPPLFPSHIIDIFIIIDDEEPEIRLECHDCAKVVTHLAKLLAHGKYCISTCNLYPYDFHFCSVEYDTDAELLEKLAIEGFARLDE